MKTKKARENDDAPVTMGVFKMTVGTLNTRIDTLDQNVAILKDDVCVLRNDVHELKDDVRDLKKDMSELKGDVADFKDSFPRHVGALKEANQHMIEQLIESFNMKREAFERYMDGNEEDKEKSNRRLDRLESKVLLA